MRLRSDEIVDFDSDGDIRTIPSTARNRRDSETVSASLVLGSPTLSSLSFSVLGCLYQGIAFLRRRLSPCPNHFGVKVYVVIGFACHILTDGKQYLEEF